jgi:hypothetical protein
MNQTAIDESERLRFLECWLPLAMELNQQLSWGDDAPLLQALVLNAADDLAKVETPDNARMTMCAYHTAIRRVER